MKVFDTLDDQWIADVIRNSKSKVVFIAPGIRMPVAKAIVSFAEQGSLRDHYFLQI